MTFDPFGDFATRGYLRNVAKAKNSEIVQRLLQNSFLTGIDAALDYLKARPSLCYADVLQTHKALFEGVFPWAGEDRLVNASHIFVKNGEGSETKDIADAIKAAPGLDGGNADIVAGETSGQGSLDSK